MARTAVNITTLTANAWTDDPAGTAADATNDHYVLPTQPFDQLFIRVTHTTASAKTCTIIGGDNPPADASADIAAKSFANGSSTPVVRFVGPFTSAQFIQSGADAGRLHIDLETGFTGYLEAFIVPRTA